MILGSRTVPQDEEIGMEVKRFVVRTILGLVVVLMQARDVTDLSSPRKFEDLLSELRIYLFQELGNIDKYVPSYIHESLSCCELELVVLVDVIG